MVAIYYIDKVCPFCRFFLHSVLRAAVRPLILLAARWQAATRRFEGG